MATSYRDKCLNSHEEACKNCETTENIVVHHIDGDRENANLENLIPLCRTCHSQVHTSADPKTEYLTELQDELPDGAIAFRPGDGQTTKRVALTDETKALLDDLKPNGITYSAFIKHALMQAPPLGRSFGPHWNEDGPKCPNCHRASEQLKDYYEGHHCMNENCEVQTFMPDYSTSFRSH